MSNTIIANNPTFICHYHDFQLPKFETSLDDKPRNPDVLISQIAGCVIRGDMESADVLWALLVEAVQPLRETEHGNRVADEYLRRVNFYTENYQELGAKYINQWLDEKENRK